jgi:hypothetical protein
LPQSLSAAAAAAASSFTALPQVQRISAIQKEAHDQKCHDVKSIEQHKALAAASEATSLRLKKLLDDQQRVCKQQQQQLDASAAQVKELTNLLANSQVCFVSWLFVTSTRALLRLAMRLLAPYCSSRHFHVLARQPGCVTLFYRAGGACKGLSNAAH